MRTLNVVLAAALAIGAANLAQAGISYTTAGSLYSQNFNSDSAVGGFPAATNPFVEPPIAVQYNGSAHIQNGNAPWAGGWRDDYAADASYLGVPGWHLWSDISTLNASTGGFNEHAQFRYGGGNATSGTGFFAFSTTTCLSCGEKSLGIRSATLFTNSNEGRRSYIGLQLINDTGATLNSFTVTYDGEQYSEAAGTSQDGFDLQWSLVTTAGGWKSSDVNEAGGFYDGTSGVDFGGFANSFLSPINNNPLGAAATHNVEGNRIADIQHTISDIEWAPGAELWIRWRDGDAHDGIGIDNVRFTASADDVGVDGDFNGDTIVDGHDFLAWQRGESPNGLDAGDLQEWEDNFPASVPAITAIPEPSTWALCALAAGAIALRRRIVA